MSDRPAEDILGYVRFMFVVERERKCNQRATIRPVSRWVTYAVTWIYMTGYIRHHWQCLPVWVHGRLHVLT